MRVSSSAAPTRRKRTRAACTSRAGPPTTTTVRVSSASSVAHISSVVRAARTAKVGSSPAARLRNRVRADPRSGTRRHTRRVNGPSAGSSTATPTRLNSEWNAANVIASPAPPAMRVPSQTNAGSVASARAPVPRLNSTCAMAVRRAATVAPSAASSALGVVPMFWPIARAAACSSPITPAASAVRVVATAALDDCMMSVMAAPIPTSSSRPSSGNAPPVGSGRAAAVPAMADCISPMPTKSRPNPASGRPAAPQRSRPTSRRKAPAATASIAMAVMSSLRPK